MPTATVRTTEDAVAFASATERAVEFARSRQARFVNDLARLVSFPSVSAQPAHAGDVRRCAAWLVRELAAIGLDHVRAEQTAGNPIVTADWRRRPGAPTLLIYGHYDVQPAEPVGAWQTPPFTPVIRGDRLAGRGASDDKGQLLAHLHAIAAWIGTSGSLPVNILCLFEGEEEIGSPRLRGHLGSRRAYRQADVAVLSDTPMLGPTRPALVRSLRGDLALELEAIGAPRDLHSGTFGGVVSNPLEALCRVLDSMHDASGGVSVEGFYARVRPLARREREAMARFGPSDAEILRAAGIVRATGERGYTLYERRASRPALTVTGLTGGYAGDGFKAVVPSRALAKVDVRLVPDQRPDEIALQLRRHVAALTPAGVRIEVRVLEASAPATLDVCHPVARTAARAYERSFGAAPAIVGSGGTVPVVAILQDELEIPTVLMGFGLPADLPHAPDESAHLPTLARGVETCIRFMSGLASAEVGL